MSDEPVIEPFDPALAVLAASRSPLAPVLERSIIRIGVGEGTPMVAVSGGADSMALLLLAHALGTRRRPPIFRRLVVGHVDHGIRPEGAKEAALVRGVAERLGMEFAMESLAWPGGEAVSSAQARDARWAALQRLAVEQGADTILCGHHADDQAETVLLRLARGTGLKGMAGIPQSRQLDAGVRIVRPLLTARRDAILDLIETTRVPVVDDPTNHRRDLARGVIRHEILPRLESLHPGATGRIAATAEEAGSVAWDSPDPSPRPCPESVRWSRSKFRGHDPATVSTMIRESIRGVPGLEPGVVEAVSRTTWSAIARAILDQQDRPRDFGLPGLGRLRVEVRSVEIRLDGDDPNHRLRSPHE